jgi:GT2 family glycosyltransferase
MMDLSILIVNWKSAAFLRECLRSIYATAGSVRFEVIVVDNASFDGSEQMVRREFPGVTFIQSKENLGFAGANNAAFACSIGRNVLFLNPDTELRGNALEVMCATLDSVPDAGIVGCKLLNSDLSVQTSCIQAFPSILGEVLDFEFLRALFPNSPLWGMQALGAPGNQPAVVEVISGACLMIRRAVFEQVGQFSVGYFMYAEDTDLCYKVAQSGWRNYFVGGATVIHHGGRSSSSRPDHFAAVMMRESRLTFMRTRRGRGYAFCYRCATTLIAAVRILMLVAALPFTNVARSLVKWFKILRWSLGLESWASTYKPRLSTSSAKPLSRQASAAPEAEQI